MQNLSLPENIRHSPYVLFQSSVVLANMYSCLMPPELLSLSGYIREGPVPFAPHG